VSSKDPFGDLPEFEDWLPVATAKFLELRGITRQPLSDNSVQMQKQLREVEAWQGTVSTMLAEATSYLAIEEERSSQYYHQDEGPGDRKRRVKSETEKERRILGLIQGQVDAIKNRLILGENLNRSNSERNRNNT